LERQVSIFGGLHLNACLSCWLLSVFLRSLSHSLREVGLSLSRLELLTPLIAEGPRKGMSPEVIPHWRRLPLSSSHPRGTCMLCVCKCMYVQRRNAQSARTGVSWGWWENGHRELLEEPHPSQASCL
jgi:hypothetical protein